MLILKICCCFKKIIFFCEPLVKYIENYYIVPVAEKVFVIPAEAGIQFFRSGPLLSQG